MSFLELLLILLLLAVCLLQVSRRVGLPYPTLLAGAGVLAALIPGMPTVTIDPATALTIFIAPALVAAAYEFPCGRPQPFARRCSHSPSSPSS